MPESATEASLTASPAPFRRVLLKVSGEALMGPKGFGIDLEAMQRIGAEVAAVHRLGVEVGLVIGAGNLFRGVSDAASGIERTSADHMGMLATVMNALAVQSVLEKFGIHTRVQSAIPMAAICEPYIRRRAIRHMEKGRIVIFAAGTGNPFFTTDTAAALRAVETGCDVLLKGTQVDGVYDADPKVVADAVRFDHLTYQNVVSRNLKVMDTAAIALARDNRLPIIVFSIHKPGAFAAVIRRSGTFTMIDEGGRSWKNSTSSK
ncbi:MAG: UMP kinase [Rhodospirillales bacterium]|nr:MAG: UMP kinase [Rhodospirillales bacterium]